MRKTVRALSFVEASFRRREAGRKEKKNAQGTMGRGKRKQRVLLFPSSHRPPRASCFFITAIFMGYPAGTSAEERAVREKVN